VSATVDFRVREDGSGVVRLLVEADAAAVKAAESGGVPIEQAVRLDDLADAGWELGTWARAEDGSASVVLSKRFETVDEVADIAEEASGAHGPLRDLRATRDSGFLATKYTLEGRIDLEGVTTGLADDPEVLANLTAQSVDPTVIDQQLLAQVKSSFALEVVARLPGAPADRTKADPGAVTTIEATSNVRATTQMLFLAAAIVLAVLAIALWIFGNPKRRPRQRRTPKPKPRPPSGQGPRKRVPRPHLPEHMPRPHLPEHMPRPHLPEHMPRPHLPEHMPRPHLPHPHLPGRSRPDAPPPPPRKPPMIPPGMT
jgi:hypothetical protein